MKSPQLLTLGGMAILLASCGSFKSIKQPLSGGDFDPLNAPGSKERKKRSAVRTQSPSYKTGQWVETSMDNATFFRAIPKGAGRADKVLKARTPMKVISSKGTYVKVELDSGSVGYVPEIMVTERRRRRKKSTPVVSDAPELGPVPPPLVPDLSTPGVAPTPTPTTTPAPELPGTSVPIPAPIPGVPPLPASPNIPSSVPTVPGIAPPPAVPGIN